MALLFSEGHFPTVASPDGRVQGVLGGLIRECRLNQVMVEAAVRGSIGSACVLMRVLKGRVFLEVLDTVWLTPEWDAEAPDTLKRVVERYKAPGSELVASGYEGVDPEGVYWFQRVWDEEGERWFLPQAVGEVGAAREDVVRSVRHGLGFVPMVWIRNLPGGVAPDGGCTFRAAVETGIEIDYQLSQAGRRLKYSSDPTLLIKEPAGVEGELVRGGWERTGGEREGGCSAFGDNGTAAEAVLSYVRLLREFALEGVHGNRADGSRLGAPASGRALELMNQGLVWLADNLRVSYGEEDVLPLCRMMLRAAERHPVRVGGVLVEGVDAGGGASAGLAGLVSGEFCGAGDGCGDADFVAQGGAVEPGDGCALACGGVGGCGGRGRGGVCG